MYQQWIFLSTEHIKYAKQYKLIIYICVLSCTCIIVAIVPGIRNRVINSTITKSNFDHGIPTNFRSGTIFLTFSKLLEIYILKDHTFHDVKLSFMENHGTNMAVSLTRYVFNYYMNRVSSMFSRS